MDGVGTRAVEEAMEYAEAINAHSFECALHNARALRARRTNLSIEQAARQAVDGSFCTCVTEGEDAAERRFSDVHRRLVEEVAEELRAGEKSGPAPANVAHRPTTTFDGG